MKLTFVIPALAILAFVSSAPRAFALETVTTEQFSNHTLSTKLTEPDDIIQDMSQRYTGHSATIAHFGNVTVGIVGPGGYGATGESPFLADPSAGMVPSKRQW